MSKRRLGYEALHEHRAAGAERGGRGGLKAARPAPDLKINALIPPNNQKHGQSLQAPGTGKSIANQMRALLIQEDNRALYALRKTIVEPVFGQIKRCMDFTQFSVRSTAKALSE